MSLTIKSPTDDRLFNPNHSIAHNLVDLIKHASLALEENNIEPELKPILEKFNVSSDKLAGCVSSLLYYVIHANDPDVKSPKEAIDKSEFLNNQTEAQIITLAKLGQILLCAYFTATREVNDPKLVRATVKEIMSEAAKQSRYLTSNQ